MADVVKDDKKALRDVFESAYYHFKCKQIENITAKQIYS